MLCNDLLVLDLLSLETTIENGDFQARGFCRTLNHQQQTLKELKENSVFGHFLCRGISWAKSSVLLAW